MILHRFPVDYQMDSQDCGPACLKIIAKYFGRFYSLQYLRDRCGITKQGVSLENLSTGAESLGLRTLAIKCTLDDIINKIPFPAILFWRDSHFIVVYHANKNTFGFLTLPKDVSNIHMRTSKPDGIKRRNSRRSFSNRTHN